MKKPELNKKQGFAKAGAEVIVRGKNMGRAVDLAKALDLDRTN